jgi:hypothetical protein
VRNGCSRQLARRAGPPGRSGTAGPPLPAASAALRPHHGDAEQGHAGSCTPAARPPIAASPVAQQAALSSSSACTCAVAAAAVWPSLRRRPSLLPAALAGRVSTTSWRPPHLPAAPAPSPAPRGSPPGACHLQAGGAGRPGSPAHADGAAGRPHQAPLWPPSPVASGRVAAPRGPRAGAGWMARQGSVPWHRPEHAARPAQQQQPRRGTGAHPPAARRLPVARGALRCRPAPAGQSGCAAGCC